MNRQNAGKVWLREEIDQLIERYASHMGIEEMANAHGRTVGAVLGKLSQVGLLLARPDGYYRVEADPWITTMEVREIGRRDRNENP